MHVPSDYPLDTGFASLREEFNHYMGDYQKGFRVNMGLPGPSRNLAQQDEAFWLFWETNKLPEETSDRLKRYIHVWTPSSWLHGILENCGVENDLVHVARDLSRFIPGTTKKNPKLFRFLWVNDWIHRKGGDVLLEAFLAAFSKKDDVELVVKPTYTNRYCTFRLPRVGEILRQLDGSAKKKVRVIERFLSPKDLTDLYYSSDCYVYPLRSQGASLTLVEAQLCGLSCIVTRYGGCLDYVDSRSTYFVDPSSFEPVGKVDFFSGFEEDLGTQAVLDVKEFASLLRYCFEHRDEVHQRGEAARQFAQKNFNWSRTREEIQNAVERPVGNSANPAC